MSEIHIYHAASVMLQMGKPGEKVQEFMTPAKHHVQWKKENPELLPFEVLKDNDGKENIVNGDYISSLRYAEHLKNNSRRSR